MTQKGSETTQKRVLTPRKARKVTQEFGEATEKFAQVPQKIDFLGDSSEFLGDFSDFLGDFSDFLGDFSDFLGGFSDFLGGFSDFLGGFSDFLGGLTQFLGGSSEFLGGFTEFLDEINDRLGDPSDRLDRLSEFLGGFRPPRHDFSAHAGQVILPQRDVTQGGVAAGCGPPPQGGAPVPMLSRWRMQEQHGGALGLSQVQYVFLELPKYRSGDDPQGTIDRWAYFFREAENLKVVPPALSQTPFREALEVARMAGFSSGELDLYDRAKIAEQDARGALSLAEQQGRAEGLREGRAEGLQEGRTEGLQEGRTEGLLEGSTEGLREAVRTLCQALDIELDAERESVLAALGAPELKELQARLLRERGWS